VISGQLGGHNGQAICETGPGGRAGLQVQQQKFRAVQQAEDGSGRGVAQIEVGSPLPGGRGGCRVVDSQAGQAHG
jgi:hypothetical protein